MTTARDVIAEWLHERYGDCFEHEHADELATLLNQWRPIETAPKDGSLFICWCIRREPFDPAPTYFHNFARWLGNHFQSLSGDLCTHWLPLPAPPSEDKI